MNKILHITFQSPKYSDGGGIGIVQSIASTSSCDKVDYVGPWFDLRKFEQFDLDKCFFLQEKGGFFKYSINMLRGVSIKYYQEWRKASRFIHSEEYKVVFVDFSYNDYVIRWAKKNNLKTIVRVHNIEYDMVDVMKRGSGIRKIEALINGWIKKRREFSCIHMADRLAFLSNADLERACELYGDDVLEKSVVVPVCLDEKKRSLRSGIESTNRNAILFTGYLGSSFNENGVVWFIQKVWKKLLSQEACDGYRMVVAGKKPSDRLITLCDNTKRCEIYDTPKDIEPFFADACIYIAPLFSGAGMKVKVAEAFSHGIYVVGTPLALVGYEKMKPYFFIANDEEEFASGIENVISGTLDIDREQCIEDFYDHYSIDESKKEIRRLIESACLSDIEAEKVC